MTFGTIAVIVVLIALVGAIVYRWIKARRTGASPQCGGCSNCSGCGTGSNESNNSHEHSPSCHNS